jgi:uncharacterized Fe-S cluster protein YjdI
MMEELIKEYTNGDITVMWEPKKCIHSTKCWKNLGEVFNPRVKPWIALGETPSQKIVDQVSQCPSKALSIKNIQSSPTSQQVNDSISLPEITVIKNGPLMVKGNVSMKHKDGREEAHSDIYLCRCGQSANKPFCDGTHRKCGFKDE